MTLKLNLGAGEQPIDGYTNVDIKDGGEAFPLDYPDDSADEIRASHILEHFPHGQTMDVIKDWYRVLKPGGVLKVAVPNFDTITRVYQARKQNGYPIEGVTMGGQIDDNDYHKAIFDNEKLRSILKGCGLVRVEHWQSEIKDCASLDISLNLMAVKPTAEQEKKPNVQAVMSVPRLGFMDNFFCCMKTFAPMNIPVRKTTGAFWGPCLDRAMQMAIDEGADIIITCDYDTVFDIDHVTDLMHLVKSYPEIDAFAPLQVSRGNDDLLMCRVDENGNAIANHDARPFYECDVVPTDTAHFGLTAIRVSALEKMERPWFLGIPATDGTWGEGRVDDDIYFWQALKRAGGKVALCPRIPIGHMELMVRWPDKDLQAISQTVGEYHENGEPVDVWR